MRLRVLVLIAMLVPLVAVAPAHAQVSVDIGIRFPAPPHLVVVPQIPAVQWVPDARVNVFFHSAQYWVFTNSSWYKGPGPNGPWIVVGPQFVPTPLLRVPVRYYHVPPGHWKKWQAQGPPHWHEDWGDEWAKHRGWKHDHHDDHHGHGKGHGKGGGHGKGHGGKGKGG